MSEYQRKTHPVRQVAVEPEHAGQRIDNYLLSLLKGVPKSYIYRILRRGEVRVNKGRIRARYRLQIGDILRLPPMRLADEREPARPDNRLLERLKRSIIHEDERILVINKPSGVAVHGGSGVKYGVIEALRQLWPEQRQLELVHRLDRDTSGALMIAKKRSALRILHELLREKRVDKRYVALLSGQWPQESREIDLPLLKNRLKSGERIVLADTGGKSARTRFRPRERYLNSMLVEVQPVTGRTHQIRVHADHLGTPILGDEKYGDEVANMTMRKLGLKRLFLHAESLRFRWPGERHDLFISTPLEPALEAFLHRLRKDVA